MATTLVEQLSDVIIHGDTLMKIGMSSVDASHDQKLLTATWNFKVAAILWDCHLEDQPWLGCLLQLDIMLQDPKPLRTPGTLLMVCSGASEIQMYIKVLST